jgi:lipopolysaccharide transport system permease protein
VTYRLEEGHGRAPELTIHPGGANRQYLQDVWNYRELLYFLAWRDLSIRYKQAVVGVLWTVLRPLFTVVAFVLVFNKIARISSTSIPYPLLVLVGLLPWTFFSTALAESSNSVVSNAHIVSKVYFPRILVPMSSVVVALVDTMVSLVILTIMFAVFRFSPDWRVVFLPFLLLATFLAAAGPGLFLAALNVRYRDVRFIVPFIIQFGLYVTPVGFPITQVPERFRTLYWILNPLVPIVEAFRWCLLRGNGEVQPAALAWSCTIIVAMGIFGVLRFRRTEHSIADEI